MSSRKEVTQPRPRRLTVRFAAPMTTSERSMRGRLIALQRHYPEGSPEIDRVREEFARSRIATDLADWASAAAEALPPMCQSEVQAVARIAAVIDARLKAS